MLVLPAVYGVAALVWERLSFLTAGCQKCTHVSCGINQPQLSIPSATHSVPQTWIAPRRGCTVHVPCSQAPLSMHARWSWYMQRLKHMQAVPPERTRGLDGCCGWREARRMARRAWSLKDEHGIKDPRQSFPLHAARPWALCLQRLSIPPHFAAPAHLGTLHPRPRPLLAARPKSSQWRSARTSVSARARRVARRRRPVSAEQGQSEAAHARMAPHGDMHNVQPGAASACTKITARRPGGVVGGDSAQGDQLASLHARRTLQRRSLRQEGLV